LPAELGHALNIFVRCDASPSEPKGMCVIIYLNTVRGNLFKVLTSFSTSSRPFYPHFMSNIEIFNITVPEGSKGSEPIHLEICDD
jgi:hypothetical protein